MDGRWLEGRDEIASAAINFYQDLFTGGNLIIDLSIMSCIPRLISEEDNIMLLVEPTHEEVRNAIFYINLNNVVGLDSFNSLFFQQTWSIIGDDMVKLVRAVFHGDQMPRFFISTCLLLIPKIDSPQAFSNFRPITLSNVTQKMVLKVMNDILSRLLPKIISITT